MCCNAGALFDYLHDMDNVVPLTMVQTFSRDCASAMAHLHENNIVQRDLKSKNLLLSAHLLLKVADFGLSRINDSEKLLTSYVGTPFWAAPEIILHEPYNEKVDVYRYPIPILNSNTRWLTSV